MGFNQFSSGAKSLFAKTLDWLFPQRCAGCGRLGEAWCSECNQQAELIGKPYCLKCGTPMEIQKYCRQCATWKYNFDEARAWGNYSGKLRKAILRLKKHHNIDLGTQLATNMAEVLAAQSWKVDLLTPIPLAQHRLKERGYNQTELLARPLAALSGLGYAGNILRRRHETVKQFELDAYQRWDNLLGAFQVEEEDLNGSTILIVDDIMTTGATLNAAALALKTAGCKHVYALTLARTLLHAEISNQEDDFLREQILK